MGGVERTKEKGEVISLHFNENMLKDKRKLISSLIRFVVLGLESRTSLTYASAVPLRCVLIPSNTFSFETHRTQFSSLALNLLSSVYRLCICNPPAV